MTPNEEIRRALERLESGEAFVNIEVPRVFANALEAPLAALIRHASTGEDCFICGGTNRAAFTGGYRQLKDVNHDNECALLDLVRAINGEQT